MYEIRWIIVVFIIAFIYGIFSVKHNTDVEEYFKCGCYIILITMILGFICGICLDDMKYFGYGMTTVFCSLLSYFCGDIFNVLFIKENQNDL